MTGDVHDILAAEIATMLRGEGEPAVRYALARSVATMMTVQAAQALADLVAQTGSVTAAAAVLEISPQAVSKTLAKHGHPAPPAGRPKTKETTDAART